MILKYQSPQTAIIGQGPAGLLSAIFLFFSGHTVTIFEARKQFSRNQRIVISYQLISHLYVLSNFADRSIKLEDPPGFANLGINFVLTNTHLLEPDKYVDDHFFQLLIDNGFVIKIQDLQHYLELKLQDEIAKAQQAMATGKSAKENWEALNPYIRLTLCQKSYRYIYNTSLQRSNTKIIEDMKRLGNFEDALAKAITYLHNGVKNTMNYIKGIEGLLSFWFFDLTEMHPDVYYDFFITQSGYKNFIYDYRYQVYYEMKFVGLHNTQNKTRLEFLNNQSEQCSYESFDHVNMAAGYNSELCNSLNLFGTEKVQLAGARHTTHGIMHNHLNLQEFAIPKSRHIIAPTLFGSMRLSTDHLSKLRELGWQKSYVPICYIQVIPQENTIYITGEVPDDYQQFDNTKLQQALSRWAKVILAIEYGVRDTQPFTTDHTSLFTISDSALTTNLATLPIGGYVTAVGDFSMPACYLYGHGIIEAIIDAKALYSFYFTDDRKNFEARQKEKIQEYDSNHKMFNDVLESYKDHPMLKAILFKAWQYGDYSKQLAKVVALAAAGGLTAYNFYRFLAGDGLNEILNNSLVGSVAGTAAGACYGAVGFFKRVHEEQQSLSKNNTVISYYSP